MAQHTDKEIAEGALVLGFLIALACGLILSHFIKDIWLISGIALLIFIIAVEWVGHSATKGTEK